jgi:hypothetical protein
MSSILISLTSIIIASAVLVMLDARLQKHQREKRIEEEKKRKETVRKLHQQI